MAIGKIKASRVNNVDAPTYVGEAGILFYNFANGVIRLSDGITSGGVPVPYTIASNTVIGGIKAGPGIVISNEGELFIDSANLAFSFGNFTADNNVLTIVNTDEDMYLRSSGNANINLIGGVHFYKPNGFPPDEEPFFRVKDCFMICESCRKLEREEQIKCNHVKQTAHWLSKRKGSRLMALYKTDPGTAIREFGGIIEDDFTPCFRKEDIARVFALPSYGRNYSPHQIYVAVDPNGGGPSQLAIVTGYYDGDTNFVVSFFFIFKQGMAPWCTLFLQQR